MGTADKKPWPLHLVEPRGPKHAMLAKRTTDEANSHQDVSQQTNAIKEPVSHTAEQLEDYEENYLEAGRQLYSKRTQLARIAKVRTITQAEEKELADLQRAYNLHRKIWARARKGKPTTHRVHPPKQSLEELLESPKLHELARSSGYSVRALAEAKRAYFDAVVTVRSFKSELFEIRQVRGATDQENAQLQTLQEAVKLRKRIFDRMSTGRAADGDPALPRMDLTRLVKDAEIQRIAQAGGYPVEEVARQKRGYLDARYKYLDAQRSIAAIKEQGGTLTPDDETRFTKIDDDYQLQKTRWNRMNRGEPVEPAVPPAAKLSGLGKAVAGLRPKTEVDEAAPASVKYSSRQMARYNQRYREALDQLHAFQEKISAAEKSGRTITFEEEDQLDGLQNVSEQRRIERDRARQGLLVNRPDDDRSSVTYSAEEIDGYNELHLDALRRLRSFERKLDAGRQAGRPPTADDQVRLRALRDDFNEKKNTWTRARNSKPVDRAMYKPRAESVPKHERSPESRPGSAAQRSQGKAEAEAEADHSTNQPLQMSGHRLLAPVLSSASHVLRGLGRQWRAMPWTRYLAHPRVNMAKPAELLRAEPAL
ncbi:MAG: hypothetical protein M1826_000068 [Phylliscum demangeonii]|nr:MAG: hypothetical protein M1826_000068 [Phylliscum demangeonii]